MLKLEGPYVCVLLCPLYSGLIQEGDVIEQIDGTNCSGISAQELTALIRGPVDSEATIHLRRKGTDHQVIARRWLEDS